MSKKAPYKEKNGSHTEKVERKKPPYIERKKDSQYNERVPFLVWGEV